MKRKIAFEHTRRESQGACLLRRVPHEGNVGCLASADCQREHGAENASVDGLAARKVAPGMWLPRRHGTGSTNKLRGACSTLLHAQDPNKSMKYVGSIATGSSILYVEAIAAPHIIASQQSSLSSLQPGSYLSLTCHNLSSPIDVPAALEAL